jgi:hypothetical protein
LERVAPDERTPLIRKIAQRLRPGGTQFVQGSTIAPLNFSTGWPEKLAHVPHEETMRMTFADDRIIDCAAMKAKTDFSQIDWRPLTKRSSK